MTETGSIMVTLLPQLSPPPRTRIWSFLFVFRSYYMNKKI